MQVQQFYDEGLAHASYAILSGNEIALVDPARNPQPYYDFARAKQAKIVAVVETHPHADFVSSHLEIHQDQGATIYASRLTGADYPHEPFDDGQRIRVGDVFLKAYNTPGHSPDSISVVLEEKTGKTVAVFTGDTLFIGDVGRPDLREKAGNIHAKREELAREMYRSTRDILMKLNSEVVVYPAHGSGTLCGKNLSDKLVSTIGEQLEENPALQPMTEDEFVNYLLSNQPFIPKYFSYDVELNKTGAEKYLDSLEKISPENLESRSLEGALIIDVRPGQQFKQGRRSGAINLPEDGKFETWLGSVVAPGEDFYLIGESKSALELAIAKAAKIGYEKFIRGAYMWDHNVEESSAGLDLQDFKNNPSRYTILDIRNASERGEGSMFKESLFIPLPELRERIHEVPTDKPVVVHCAGGYRSTIGSSILENALKDKTVVYDLGEAISEFKNEPVAQH